MSVLKSYDEMNAEQQMAYRMGEAAAELSNDEVIGLAVQLLKNREGVPPVLEVHGDLIGAIDIFPVLYLVVPLSILGEQ